MAKFEKQCFGSANWRHRFVYASSILRSFFVEALEISKYIYI